MLVLMKHDATRDDIERVKEKIRSLGYRLHGIPGAQRVAIVFTGNESRVKPETFRQVMEQIRTLSGFIHRTMDEVHSPVS